MACASTVPPCALGTSADRRPAAKLRGQRLRGRSIAQCLAERQAVILRAGDGTGSARIGIQPAALAGKHAAGKGAQVLIPYNVGSIPQQRFAGGEVGGAIHGGRGGGPGAAGSVRRCAGIGILPAKPLIKGVQGRILRV